MFGALSIPLIHGANWIISGPQKSANPVDPDTFVHCETLPEGWLGFPEKSGSIAVKQGLIRLIETVAYQWIVTGEKGPKISVSNRNQIFSTTGESSLNCLKGESPRGSFQIINFLGFSDMIFEIAGQPIPVRLEFISKKLDYDTEYRAMTGEIAKFCSQLLLSWNTPTGLQFSPDPEKLKQIALEQFLFLRHFLNDTRFDSCLEIIQSRPHRELKKDREWRPAIAVRSTEFLVNPIGMARDWRTFTFADEGAFKLPAEVLDVTRTESYDTPPNRFIRFALEEFQRLCREVISLFSKNATEPPKQAVLEAEWLTARLEAALHLPFIKNCSRLTRLPLENQVLQKKEGYRDILKAWLQMHNASKLDWKGNADCYIGSSRNVDVLYEYWIFLTLHRLLNELEGVELMSGEESPENGCDPFLKTENGEVIVKLKRERPPERNSAISERMPKR